MKVLNRKILDDFKKKHANARSQIDAWIAEAEESAWKSPADIKERFVSASFLPNDRVVFNIKGNQYRLDVKIAYQAKVVFVKRIGTHAEYNSWTFEKGIE